MSFSKREKILIFIASVTVLIYASMQFVIIPMYKYYSELCDNLDVLHMEKIQIQSKIQNEPIIIKNYNNAVEIFNDINNRYPTGTPNEEVAGNLTEICRSSDFRSIISLVIPTETEELALINNGIDAFSVSKVSMSLNGGYNSLKQLINMIGETDYIRISRLSFSSPPATETGPAFSNVSVNFEITIMNDSAPLTAAVGTSPVLGKIFNLG